MYVQGSHSETWFSQTYTPLPPGRLIPQQYTALLPDKYPIYCLLSFLCFQYHFIMPSGVCLINRSYPSPLPGSVSREMLTMTGGKENKFPSVSLLPVSQSSTSQQGGSDPNTLKLLLLINPAHKSCNHSHPAAFTDIFFSLWNMSFLASRNVLLTFFCCFSIMVSFKMLPLGLTWV